MNSTHTVELRWIPAAQGGRTTLPVGPVYATTAHFANEPLSHLFSVVFEFPEGQAQPEMTAGFRLLVPETCPTHQAASARGATDGHGGPAARCHGGGSQRRRRAGVVTRLDEFVCR